MPAIASQRGLIDRGSRRARRRAPLFVVTSIHEAIADASKGVPRFGLHRFDRVTIRAPPTSACVTAARALAVTHIVDAPSTDDTAPLQDSLRLLVMQHLLRIAAQQKTREELGGPFFADYHHSVRMPQQWGDGGAITGFIWLDHSPRGKRQFELSRQYWISSVRALPWMIGYKRAIRDWAAQ